MFQKFLFLFSLVSASVSAKAEVVQLTGQNKEVYRLYCQDRDLVEFLEQTFGTNIDDLQIQGIFLSAGGIEIRGNPRSVVIPNSFKCAFSTYINRKVK